MRIIPGAKFQVGKRSYTVQSIDNGRVTYSFEGVTAKPVTMTKPLALFQQVVAPALTPALEQEHPPPTQSALLPEVSDARTLVPATQKEDVIQKPSEATGSAAPLPIEGGHHRATAPMGVKPPEFSAEDSAEFERLDRLYRGLSKGDRLYIVSRWDDEQGLEPTYKRQNFRDEASLRAKRRRLWMMVGLIPGALVLLWIGQLISADTQRHEDSFVLDELRERSSSDPGLKSAIDEADRAYREWIESQRPEPDE